MCAQNGNLSAAGGAPCAKCGGTSELETGRWIRNAQGLVVLLDAPGRAAPPRVASARGDVAPPRTRRVRVPAGLRVYDPRFAPSTAELEVIGTTDTRLQRSAADMKKAPFRYICNLEYDFPGTGRRSAATGVLVGPSTVLTVGHLQENISSFDPKKLRVFPGRRGSLEPFGSTGVKSFKLPSNYESCAGSVSYRDYMLLFLDSPIGNKAGYWTYSYAKRSYDSVGTSTYQGKGLPQAAGVLKVNVSGYPLDKPNGQGCSSGGLRCNPTADSAPTRSRTCGTFQYSAYDQTVRLIEGGRTLEYRNDICVGHSGSPVWVKRHSSMGGRVLIGMQVCQYNDASANVALLIHNDLRSFIKTHAK